MSPRRRPRRSDMVADGMLVALAAARQAVKNVLIVRALRDGADFDREAYLAVVARELESLAAEHDSDATRLAGIAERTRRLLGPARHPGDYRADDRRLLTRRRVVLTEVAERLRALATDADATGEILDRARDLALAEISATAAAVFGPRDDARALGTRERADALARLRADLRALQDRA